LCSSFDLRWFVEEIGPGHQYVPGVGADFSFDFTQNFGMPDQGSLQDLAVCIQFFLGIGLEHPGVYGLCKLWQFVRRIALLEIHDLSHIRETLPHHLTLVYGGFPDTIGRRAGLIHGFFPEDLQGLILLYLRMHMVFTGQCGFDNTGLDGIVALQLHMLGQIRS
jgi:hypothetical protein